MTTRAIDVKDLCFGYNTHPILRQISFHVEQGEFLTILGRNGAGKSTLLHCINRLLHPHSGRIDILGKSLTSYSQKALATRVGFVPQYKPQTPHFTVREFVMMGRYPHLGAFTVEQESDQDAVDKALTLTNTSHLAERTLDALSGGEYQKVFIAAALAQETPILLLDEPATFLDPVHQVEVYRLLQSLHKDEQLTIVMISHDISAAASCSQRILALKDGEVGFCGTSKDFLQPKHLEHVYGIPFTLIEHSERSVPIAIPKELP